MSQNLFVGTRDVVALRITYGTIYGVLAGLAYAAATWGWDGYLLSKTHAFMPWSKFIIAALISMVVGGLAGKETMKHEKWWVTLLSWMGVAFAFTWLAIVIPLQVSPILSGWFQPALRDFIHIQPMGDIMPRFWLAFLWIIIFVSLAGLLEVVLVESTVFASSFMGKTMPITLGILIMVVCGTIVDGLNNEPLRRAFISMDATTQFVLDHRGQEVDKALARQNHASSLRVFTDRLSSSYNLLIGEYDVQLGEIILLVDFDDITLDCVILYGQPAFCKLAE